MKPEITQPLQPQRSNAINCQCGLEIHDLGEFMGKLSSGNGLVLPTDTFLLVWLLRSKAVYCLYPGQLKFTGDRFDAKGYVLTFTSDFVCSLNSDIGLLFYS